uniref:PWI domain-containing protein n=3 Tax=Trichobilharzia regenti TaxID=157069 RepID=A0AA85J674_TRIRE|nr:unnamed protein product [Trichobilharzia regenti]
MTDAGFFKGTSAEQDARFADKKKKLMKTMKFGENLSQKVDMSKINLESIRPWIVKRITELLNFEDEVVCDYIFNQLEDLHPDPKEIQINITGFLNGKNARIFLSELWDLLLSAMQTPDGVPAAFLEAKKEEIAKRQEEEKQVQHEMKRREDELIVRGTNRLVNPPPMEQTDSQLRIPPTKSNGMSEAAELKVSSTRNRSVSRTSSPSSPRSRVPAKESREKPDKKTSRSRRDDSSSSRSPEPSRHRRRRHHSSSDRSSIEKDRHSRSRHRHRRSRSRSKVEQKPKSPVGDWRKDLMAGRRRSPPEMPESSYYGNEKHSKSHKHSKKHEKRKRSRKSHHKSPDDHRSHRHGYDGDTRTHGIPETDERDVRSGYLEHSRKDGFDENYRRYEGPDPPDHYDYRSSGGRHMHDSGSHNHNISPRSSRTRLRESERSVRDYNRHRIQEEDDANTYVRRHQAEKREISPMRSSNTSLAKRQENRLPSPEGPSLPPVVSKRPADVKVVESVVTKRSKRKVSESSSSSSSSSTTGSSSSSSSSSGSSSGGDGSSGSGSSSDDSDDDDDGEAPQAKIEQPPPKVKIPTREPTPEGPALPPELVCPTQPEGPDLPPTVEQTMEWSENPVHPGSSSPSSASSGSSSDDDENNEGSGSSSSGSSDDSSSDSSSSSSRSSSNSSSESDDDDEPSQKRVKSKKNGKQHAKTHEKNHLSPEGPALPPSIPSSNNKKMERRESVEEVLRQRALESLLRSSRKRRSSP